MNAIEVNGVSKDFNIVPDKSRTIKDLILRSTSKSLAVKFQALENVSLSIAKGEVVGLVGRNGSGKSTLLKLLSKILFPTRGNITINGRVTSLLELGAGFHPDFTGIENIYMNASIFGLSKKEISIKLDSIIAFAQIGDFITKPVRMYSSGMYMRLAFAVAISIDPDILLIDEILAVGDAAFQMKCLNRIAELKARGTTIVIVAHDQGIVERLCDTCIWLKEGNIVAQGPSREIMMKYLADSASDENNRMEDNLTITTEDVALKHSAATELRWGDRKVEIIEVKMVDGNNNVKSNFETGERAVFRIAYKKNMETADIAFGVGIFRVDGICCYGTNTTIDRVEVPPSSHSEGEFVFCMKSLHLLPGEYWLDVAIQNKMGEPYDYYRKAKTFLMHSHIQDIGVFRIEHAWELNEKK